MAQGTGPTPNEKGAGLCPGPPRMRKRLCHQPEGRSAYACCSIVGREGFPVGAGFCASCVVIRAWVI